MMIKTTATPAVDPADIRFAVLATDVVTFRVKGGALEVLLGKVHLPPHFPDSWGIIGGLIRPSETAEQSVDRHIHDKAGLGKIYREQLETFSRVDRDPRGRVVSVAYIALVDPDHSEAQDGAKDGKIVTRWSPVSRLPKLAYDHGEIVKAAIERLQARIGYTNIAQHLLPRSFTMSELQEVYQAVLGRDIDKRNFSRWILRQAAMVETTGHERKEGAHRPAALYRFKDRQTKIVVSL